MPDRLNIFVREVNIKDFARQLETEVDPSRVEVLKTLLKEAQTSTPAPSPVERKQD